MVLCREGGMYIQEPCSNNIKQYSGVCESFLRKRGGVNVMHAGTCGFFCLRYRRKESQ